MTQSKPPSAPKPAGSPCKGTGFGQRNGFYKPGVAPPPPPPPAPKK